MGLARIVSSAWRQKNRAYVGGLKGYGHSNENLVSVLTSDTQKHCQAQLGESPLGAALSTN